MSDPITQRNALLKPGESLVRFDASGWVVPEMPEKRMDGIRDCGVTGTEGESNIMTNQVSDIAAGQIWRDKDKRREQDGTVRTFIVDRVVDFMVEVEDMGSGKQHAFDMKRFGSGHANDSFERVS